MPFLRFTGAELLIEIARFWSSIATYNPELDRYEIHGVMGPDEYHDGYPDSAEAGLRNNTYTNVMAVWVLQRALEALEELPPHYRQELVDELTIRDEELDRWRDITRKMTVVFHADGVLSQFEGYEQLREFDWEGYREKYGDIQRLDRVLEAEGDSTNRYKVVQAGRRADAAVPAVAAGAARTAGRPRLRGDRRSSWPGPSTTTWSAPRTARRSARWCSAWVLARYDPEEAWRFLQRALDSDVADVQGGTTARGHPPGGDGRHGRPRAARLTGMRARGTVLRFDPALPPQIKQLRFSVHYRGHRVDVAFTEDRLEISSRPGRAAPITVLVGDEAVELHPGDWHAFSLQPEPCTEVFAALIGSTPHGYRKGRGSDRRV